MNTTPRSRFGFLAAMASVLGSFGIGHAKPGSAASLPTIRHRFGGTPRFRQSRSQRTSKGHGRHSPGPKRAPYFQPCWQRDGFKSDLAYFMHHTPVFAIQAMAADLMHPKHQLALRAVVVLKQRTAVAV